MKTDKATKIVQSVIDTLCDYAGFDAWWDDIGSGDRKILKGDLHSVVQQILEEANG